MSEKYSIKHKIHWVKLRYNGEGAMPYRDIADNFVAKFTQAKKPSPETIRNLITKFEKAGSVANISPPGRHITVTNEESSANIFTKIMQSPIKSAPKLASEAGMSTFSARKILKTHKYHPYKVQLIQSLSE